MTGENFFDQMASEMAAGADRAKSGERFTLATKQDRELMLHSRYRECNIPSKYWSMEMDLWTRQQDARGNDLSPQQARQKGYAGQFVNFYNRCLPALCRGKLCSLERRDRGRGRDFNSLVLMGGKESGKSMLASIIAKTAARIGEDVRFYEYGGILETVCSPGYSMEEQRQALLEEFRTMSLVVVDGITPGTDYPAHGDRTLRYLATARLNTGLPCVLTCGYEIQEVEGHPWADLLESDCSVRIPLPSPKTRR